MSMEIPLKCQTCPIAIGQQETIQESQRNVDLLIQSSMDDGTSELAAKFVEQIGEYSGIDVKGLAGTDDLASKMREANGKAVQGINEQIGRLEAGLEGMTSTCIGPFGMRATRDGVQFTVHVCASDAMNAHNGVESVNIQRKTVS